MCYGQKCWSTNDYKTLFSAFLNQIKGCNVACFSIAAMIYGWMILVVVKNVGFSMAAMRCFSINGHSCGQNYWFQHCSNMLW
jgi:hypothetical protein